MPALEPTQRRVENHDVRDFIYPASINDYFGSLFTSEPSGRGQLRPLVATRAMGQMDTITIRSGRQ